MNQEMNKSDPLGRSQETLPGDGKQGFISGGLARQIGRDRSEWRADDLVDLVKDRGIRLLSLMHVGGGGWLKTW